MSEDAKTQQIDHWERLLRIVGTSTVIIIPALYLLGTCYRVGYFQAVGIPFSLLDLPIQSTIVPRWTLVAMLAYAALTVTNLHVLAIILQRFRGRGRSDTSTLKLSGFGTGLGKIEFALLTILDVASLIFAFKFRLEMLVPAVSGCVVGIVASRFLNASDHLQRVVWAFFGIPLLFVTSFALGLADSGYAEGRLLVVYVAEDSESPRGATLLNYDGKRYFLLEKSDEGQAIIIVRGDQLKSIKFYTSGIEPPQTTIWNWLEHVRRHQLRSKPQMNGNM